MGYQKDENVLEVLLLSGAFERMNEMIGMEDALTAFYEYPDEVHEFFEKNVRIQTAVHRPGIRSSPSGRRRFPDQNFG